MTLKNKSIVVLLSGGLDSSTVTGIAKKSEAKILQNTLISKNLKSLSLTYLYGEALH